MGGQNKLCEGEGVCKNDEKINVSSLFFEPESI